jgi:hypothetical protein
MQSVFKDSRRIGLFQRSMLSEFAEAIAGSSWETR